MATAAAPLLVPSPAEPFKATTSPIVTGASVIAIKYADGVMMVADTLGSYGNLARFTDLRRIIKVGDHSLVGAGGEISDFQQISEYLGELVSEERCLDDGARLTAPELHSYLSRVMYGRRNKMNPLWNSVLVGGVDKAGASYVGYVDLYGTAFADDIAATGFATHVALPIIRERWRAGLSEGEARALLEDCVRVLWYRDTRALNKITLAKITAAGSVVSEPYSLDAKWDFKAFVNPKAGTDTGGSW